MTARSATWWLTIPEVCAHLQITEAEWHQWRPAGRTPLHAAGPDGQLTTRRMWASWPRASTTGGMPCDRIRP